MDEASLLKASLLCAVLGLAATALVSVQVTGAVTAIADITDGDAGRLVKVCGNVTDLFTSRNRHVFFTLMGDEGIDVVVFNTTSHLVRGTRNGDSICVTGEVGIYQGELEVILRDIHD